MGILRIPVPLLPGGIPPITPTRSASSLDARMIGASGKRHPETRKGARTDEARAPGERFADVPAPTVPGGAV